MRDKDMVALGRVVIAKRERVIMLQPWEKGLLGTTLRYPYEVRDSKDYFYDIPDVKIAPDMLKLAEHILQSKETTFDPSQFVDRCEQAVIQLLEKKQQGMPAPKARPFVAPTNVVSLMDALRQSMAAEAKAGAAPKNAAAAGTTTAITKPKKGKQRIAGQRELLLPIAGRKGQPKDKTKPAPQPAGRRKAG
jgi:DNA end-binding protein Ku